VAAVSFRCAALLLLLVPTPAAAERQIKPFLGMTFGGGTSFIDLEDAAGSPNVAFGVNTVLLGDVVGIEGDFAHVPGFFQTGDRRLVTQSSVTTLGASLVVALPRRVVEYALRPYVVGGGGLVHVRIDAPFGVLQVVRTLPMINVGAGATGFLTDQIGLSWDVRRFQSLGGGTDTRGVSLGRERLSFWRATMGVAIRY